MYVKALMVVSTYFSATHTYAMLRDGPLGHSIIKGSWVLHMHVIHVCMYDLYGIYFYMPNEYNFLFLISST